MLGCAYRGSGGLGGLWGGGAIFLRVWGFEWGTRGLFPGRFPGASGERVARGLGLRVLGAAFAGGKASRGLGGDSHPRLGVGKGKGGGYADF